MSQETENKRGNNGADDFEGAGGRYCFDNIVVWHPLFEHSH